MFLLNPRLETYAHFDETTRGLLTATLGFFENKGKRQIKADDHARTWYADFLEFQQRQGLFAHFLTPARQGSGPGYRWDTARNCALNEILGFYGLAYWYTWQVTILGLGPVWMSPNDALRQRVAGLLQDGQVFAFGLSEREHGADIYATATHLTSQPQGGYLAEGEKYYIGNANAAALISTFGRLPGEGGYAIFAVDPRRAGFELVQNVTASQNYVAHFRLHEYRVEPDEILETGPAAWDASLNTVNVGKFNLGWASIGICTHAFYEALNHAGNRRLYHQYVTDFSHVRSMFTDAYARLVAMKLFTLRAADYMRSASLLDRRYLLFNPLVKMKVTTQGEQVMDLLWDVIAARGFEKDLFFEMAVRDIRAMPKLEGTVHVNIALIVKFMVNYFFNPAEYPPTPRRTEPGDDAFLFAQGPTGGLGKIRFHAYQEVFERFNLSAVPSRNVHRFAEQTAAFKDLLARATPDAVQQQDVDFLLALGELFANVVYAQLTLEAVELYRPDYPELSDDLVEQIFDCLVRDFARYALNLYSKPSATPAQMEACLAMIRKPEADAARFGRVWEQILGLKDSYELKP